MSLVGVGTVYHGITIDAPAKSKVLTVSIEGQEVTLTKWQAQKFAEYLLDDAENLED